MKIELIQSDIDNGNPFNSYMCPIALATGRALGLFVGQVSVRNEDMAILTTKPEKIIALPKEVQRFIKDSLKSTNQLAPFTFEIEL
jgi:hypothetical protein